MTDTELLSKAICFRIWGLPDTSSYDILIESRGNDKWVVTDGGRAVYSREVKWFIYEPSPSSRTDAFKDDTRFSRDEALAIATDFATKYQAAWDRTKDNPREFVREVQPDKFGVVFKETDG